MKKFLILGEKSFVGRHLFDFLKNREACSLVSREQIDFLNPTTFSNIDFSHSVIIDCINVNNGNENEIMACNCSGFKAFNDYLKKNAVDYRYIYLSTASVLSENAVMSSPYVRSKKIAEDYLTAAGMSYQIIRLSYPVGKGENSNRLISRLIASLKQNQPITISDVLINLNAIDDVIVNMYSQFLRTEISLISNNNYLYLSEIVLFLKDRLRSESTIEIKTTTSQFMPVSENPFIPAKDIKETLLEMI